MFGSNVQRKAAVTVKVKDLIEALSQADPELTVCQFTETGPEEISDVGIFRGEHRTDAAPKMIWAHDNGKYVGLGNPGDYEATALVEDCEPVRDLGGS